MAFGKLDQTLSHLNFSLFIMDCLETTVENIERALGEAITARSIALDYYTGLGPPDLCCLNKVFVRAWLPPDPQTLPPTG